MMVGGKENICMNILGNDSLKNTYRVNNNCPMQYLSPLARTGMSSYPYASLRVSAVEQ